jgi:DNA helicase II / ATP-dependent DNA helicase PcrA
MPIVQITSDTLIPIDRPFRISAGPGAGKTHWLVLHIQQVLQHSLRLGCNRKIACITYTNIAVDTILRRLNFIADRVEVSTIHSFIYNNVIKPYVSFLAGEYELNVAKLDGHDDHYVSRKRVTDWINNHPNHSKFSHPYTANQITRIEHNLEAVSRWLSSLHYVFNSGCLELAADNSEAFYLEEGQRRHIGRAKCLDRLVPGLLEYKKIFWRKGIIHHDDVLFFGYTLLRRYPFILSVLQAKFPYFFVDEFQDTSPIQAEILRLIGARETIVGIIGDKAQSIYSFQGAAPEHFSAFTLPNLLDYVIADNRRSTNPIVGLLNHVRTDIRQNAIRNAAGCNPTLFVGPMRSALAEAVRISGTGAVTTLSWDNITANALKRHLNTTLPIHDLLGEIFEKDGNSIRRRVVVSCINAVELARQKRFKEAIKEMDHNFSTIANRDKRKKMAFDKLRFLLSKYNDYKSRPLYDFHQLIRGNLRGDIANLSKGTAMTFYTNCSYEQLAVCVNIADDNSANRTIHKAKGDEFDNVLVVLKTENHLNFVLAPNLSAEQHRIFYVAISRGRERLFISVPDLSAAKETQLNGLFNIRRIGAEVSS